MPIPKRESGESEDKFIGRCMSAIEAEYSQEQALGICYSAFREGMSTENKIASKLRQMKKYEGIDLRKVEMIEPNPCWDGYEAIGTKVVDGREVPNCVPIKD
jgi:hypothetical protein